MRQTPAPGYLILKPHSVKKKIGGFEIPDTDSEDKPELGEVLEVGPQTAKMPFDVKYVPKKGEVIAYKKYNNFKIKVGTKDYVVVHFSNFLFTLEESEG